MIRSKNEQPILFASIARRRPEWIAQGLLMHAIRTETGVRKLLAQRLGRRWATPPEVFEEQKTESGWRADILLRWADGGTDRLELKLGAPPTRRQTSAGKKGLVPLVVLPNGRSARWAHRATGITWEQIAEECRDAGLRRLLREAADASSWVLESVALRELEAEFKAFVTNSRELPLRETYRLLCAVDRHLLALAGKEYLPNKGWTVARSSRGYYGYCFYVGRRAFTRGSPRFWVGVAPDERGRPRLMLSVPSDSNEPCFPLSSGAMVHASQVARAAWKLASTFEVSK